MWTPKRMAEPERFEGEMTMNTDRTTPNKIAFWYDGQKNEYVSRFDGSAMCIVLVIIAYSGS